MIKIIDLISQSKASPDQRWEGLVGLFCRRIGGQDVNVALEWGNQTSIMWLIDLLNQCPIAVPQGSR